MINCIGVTKGKGYRGINMTREDGVSKVAAKNLIRDGADLDSQDEIKCMNWSDERREEILISSKNGVRMDVIWNSLVVPAEGESLFTNRTAKFSLASPRGAYHRLQCAKVNLNGLKCKVKSVVIASWCSEIRYRCNWWQR